MTARPGAPQSAEPATSLIPAPAGYPIKLVRDNTPEILNGSGEPGALWYGPSMGDRQRWLRLKLAEEVGEYLVDGGFSELRDVLAVVAALAREHDSDLAGLVQALEADPRGGFIQGVMMYGHHREFDGGSPSQRAPGLAATAEDPARAHPESEQA